MPAGLFLWPRPELHGLWTPRRTGGFTLPGSPGSMKRPACPGAGRRGGFVRVDRDCPDFRGERCENGTIPLRPELRGTSVIAHRTAKPGQVRAIAWQ